MNHDHEADLIWRFNDADGELGLASSFGPIADLALAGIPDGGTIAQPTRARMSMWKGGESPVQRARRIDETLEAVGDERTRVLRRRFTRGRWLEDRRHGYEDGTRANPNLDPILGLLTPAELEYEELARVAPLVDADAEREASRARGKRGAERDAARLEVARIRARARAVVEEALAAYATAARTAAMLKRHEDEQLFEQRAREGAAAEADRRAGRRRRSDHDEDYLAFLNGEGVDG